MYWQKTLTLMDFLTQSLWFTPFPMAQIKMLHEGIFNKPESCQHQALSTTELH